MKHHHESHNASPAGLRDLVIGMSDGLTVPFALAAGLSGAVDSTAIIVTAGLAEIAAGAIAMGLGGYLGAKTEAQHYASEYAREMREVEQLPHVEINEVGEILREFGVPEAQIQTVTEGICAHPERWVNFMMKFELNLEKPDPSRLIRSPLIIGGAYIFGGLIPLFPYMMTGDIKTALAESVAMTMVALLGFGAFKGYFTGVSMLKSAAQTGVIGGIAAAAAYGIASLF